MTAKAKKRFHLPENRYVRLVLGCLLVVGGILGFLPILGFWMIPLGLYILSKDSPRLRRWRRRLAARWGRSPTVLAMQAFNTRWAARIRRWSG